MALAGAAAAQSGQPPDQPPGQPADPAQTGAASRGPAPAKGGTEAAPEAQPPAEPLTDLADRQISLKIELRPWYVAPGGRFTLPGETRGGRDIDVEELNLDSARLSPAGLMRLEVDEWSFTLSAAHSSADRRTTSTVSRPIGDIDLMAGDQVRTTMDFTTVEFLVGNTFFQRSLRAYDDPDTRFGLQLEAGLGARLDHFEIHLTRDAGGEASANESFLMPLAAIEARFQPAPRATLSFAATAGWNPGINDHTAITSDLIVRAAWQFTPRIQALAGYRITIQRMETGDGPQRFEFLGSYAGLFAGVRIGF